MMKTARQKQTTSGERQKKKKRHEQNLKIRQRRPLFRERTLQRIRVHISINKREREIIESNEGAHCKRKFEETQTAQPGSGGQTTRLEGYLPGNLIPYAY